MRVGDMLEKSYQRLNEHSIDVSLYDNIIMAGGNTNIPGYTEYLKHSVIPFARKHVNFFKN